MANKYVQPGADSRAITDSLRGPPPRPSREENFLTKKLQYVTKQETLRHERSDVYLHPVNIIDFLLYQSLFIFLFKT